MSDGIEPLIEEVLQLRFSQHLPEVTASPIEIIESLRETRQSLDRVEEILSKILRLKGQKSRESFSAKAEAEEAWDEAMQQIELRNNARRGTQEFIAPREKYAGANTKTLKEQRTARQSELALMRVSEAEQVIRQAHRGLDSLRQDHNTLLRAIVVETSIER